MIRRALLPFLVAAIPLLAAGPAASDMMVELDNRASVQIAAYFEEAAKSYHLPEGLTWALGPYATTQAIQVVVSGVQAALSGKSAICAGTAVLSTGIAGASTCQWVQGSSAAEGVFIRCDPTVSGDGTAQCKVKITLTPTD